jgi:hypothetical protein
VLTPFISHSVFILDREETVGQIPNYHTSIKIKLQKGFSTTFEPNCLSKSDEVFYKLS